MRFKLDSMSTLRKLMVSSALVSVAATALPVMAQTAAKAEEEVSASNDIVVTARQRNETLQDVPVAVTSISGDTLEKYNVTNIDKLESRIPSLTVQQGGSNGGASLSLRGVGTANLSPSFQSAVALDFDGVQIGQLRILQSGFFDMEQVDVLKGPQSLYFGKSASAGVLTLRSAGPTKDFQIKAKVGYETEENGKFVETSVSGPISDTLGFRLAGRYSKIKELVINDAPFAKKPFRGSEDLYLRGVLTWNPADNFTSDLRVNYIDSKRDGANLYQDIDCGPNGIADRIQGPGPLTFASGNSCITGDGRYNYSDIAPQLVANLPAGFTKNRVQPFNETKIWLGRLRNDVDLTDNFSLTSITGYYQLKTAELDSYAYGGFIPASGSTPGVSFGTSLSYAKYRTSQFSQEVRANIKELGPLDLTFGAFYERRVDDVNTLIYAANIGILAADPITGFTSDVLKLQNTKSDAYSVFASAIVDISDNLELAGGVRYTKENKLSRFSVPQVHAFLAASPFGVPVGYNTGPIRFSDDNYSPEVSLTYKLNPDVNIYAAYKTGYKSGGIDSAVLPTTPFVAAAAAGNFNSIRFGSETSKGFEFGLKSQLLDRRLTFNVAAFQYKFDNIQIIQFNPAIINFVTLNATQITTKGVDLDVTWRTPLEGLTLTSAVNYLDAKYTKDFCPTVFNPATTRNDSRNCSLGVAGTNLIGRSTRVAPKFTGNFGANIDAPIGGMKLSVNGNARFSSSYFIGDTNLRDPKQPSYWSFDTGVSLADANDKWTLSLSAVNLTDKLYLTSLTPKPGQVAGGDDQIFSYNRGRQIFITGAVKF